MKKVFKFIGIICLAVFVGGIVSAIINNGDSIFHSKDETDLSNADIAGYIEKDPGELSSNNDEITEYIPIEIDEYYRNINDYIGIPVKLKGYWSKEDTTGTINSSNFSKSINLNLYDEVIEDLDQRLMFGQRIYAYGKMVNENDNLVFKTDKIEDFTKVQNNNFWNGSKVLNYMNLSEALNNSDEYTEYEFTGIILTGGYAEREVVIDGAGLLLELVTENEAVISNGTAVRFLVSNLHYDEFNDYYTADVIDYKVLE